MISDQLVNDAIAFARAETAKYGLPTAVHFDLSLVKAEEIAKQLDANVKLVQVGAALMDIKLGVAFQQKKLPEHVRMGVEASREFLRKYPVTAEEVEKIVNCIEAHHGAVRHSCIESEIVTNSDCYRFLHPVGVISYIVTLSKRDPQLAGVVGGAEAKLEEKHQLLTLDVCKKELEPYYKSFKEVFSAAK